MTEQISEDILYSRLWIISSGQRDIMRDLV